MPPTPPIISSGATAGIGAFPSSINQPAVVIAPLMWCQTSQPAAGSQATASRSASAGNSHICCGVCATWVVTTALAAGVTVAVNLRDSSSGAGTIFWTALLGLAGTAAVGSMASIVCFGMFLQGTAGNQMTVEFANSVASTQQSISWWGYSTN